MAVAALVIAIIAGLLAIFTFAVVLLLLGGKQDRFVTWHQLSKVLARVEHLARGQSSLYRYLEGLDEATGGNGHKVLVGRVRRDDPAA